MKKIKKPVVKFLNLFQIVFLSGLLCFQLITIPSNGGLVYAAESKTSAADDLSGTWIQTEDWEGCGSAGTDTWTIKITQVGNKISFMNVDRNFVNEGTKKDNIIYVKGLKKRSRYGGFTIEHDYQLTISPAGDSFEGIRKWENDFGNCDGVTKIKLVKKVE